MSHLKLNGKVKLKFIQNKNFERPQKIMIVYTGDLLYPLQEKHLFMIFLALSAFNLKEENNNSSPII